VLSVVHNGEFDLSCPAACAVININWIQFLYLSVRIFFMPHIKQYRASTCFHMLIGGIVFLSCLSRLLSCAIGISFALQEYRTDFKELSGR